MDKKGFIAEDDTVVNSMTGKPLVWPVDSERFDLARLSVKKQENPEGQVYIFYIL